MKPLDTFLDKHPPNRRKSILQPFRDEIVYLYDNGYQVKQIQQWLSTQKVEVKKVTIYKFLEKIKVKNFSLQNLQKSKNQGETLDGFQKQEREDENESTQVPSFQELKNLLKK